MAINRQWVLSAETREVESLVLPVMSFLSPPTIRSDIAHTGVYSYGSFNNNAFGLHLPDTPTACRMGYWLYHNGYTTAPQNLVLYMTTTGFDTGDSAQFFVFINGSTGNIDFARNHVTSGVEILQSSPIPPRLSQMNSWIHVGITHNIHDTTGFCTVYIDGIVGASLVGDTRPYGRGGGMGFFGTDIPYAFCAGTYTSPGTTGFNSEGRIDDIYCDSYEAEADAAVPSYRYLPQFVSAAGADADWTPVGEANNYQNVDENPPDGDTTYNRALSINLRDTFIPTTITLPADHEIISRILFAYAKRLDAVTQPEISLHNYDGLTYDDGPDLPLNLDYYPYVWSRFTTQPDTSPWNETDINAMQLGYRSRGTF